MDLPTGAWAQGWRTLLRADERTILGFTQARARAYLYPVLSPAGYAVTAECPADHPHHNSIWVAADHVHAHLAAADGRTEEATYNFYVNETFQGRAPGRVREMDISGQALGADHFQVRQTLEWRGPVEWGSDSGRLLANETRTTDVIVSSDSVTIDIKTSLVPAEQAITIGPTRHAWFGVRIAESMTVNGGGRLIDAVGRIGGQAVSGEAAPWIDLSGPIGADHRAGIAIFPDPGQEWGPWFATDWGTVAVNPFLSKARKVAQGDAARYRLRLVVHDGFDERRIDQAFTQFTEDHDR